MSLHFCRNKDKRILLLPEERKVGRCRFCITHTKARAVQPIISDPRQPTQPTPHSWEPTQTFTHVHDIKRNANHIAITHFRTGQIDYFWGNLVSRRIKVWSETLGLDVANLAVELMNETVDHELIHAVGQLGHTRKMSQAKFHKVVGLMGHDIRLQMRHRLKPDARPLFSKLDRICLDLDKDDTNLSTSMATTERAVYNQLPLLQPSMDTYMVKIGSMEIKVRSENV